MPKTTHIEKQEQPKRLLTEPGPVSGKDAFPDAFSITAAIIENAMIQSGAVPGKDYTILDIFKLAQPFVLERYQKRELSDTGYNPAQFPKSKPQ